MTFQAWLGAKNLSFFLERVFEEMFKYGNGFLCKIILTVSTFHGAPTSAMLQQKRLNKYNLNSTDGRGQQSAAASLTE